MKRITTILACTVLLLLQAPYSFGQKKGQKKLFEEFMQVCNAYKQLPLYLNLGYKTSTNLPGGRQDTAMATGDFYISEHDAYIRFGAMEQVLTDTLGLVVMNDIKHMVAHNNNQSIAEQLKAMTGKPLSGQSLEDLLETCTIKKLKPDGETSMLVIESKKPVYAGMAPAYAIVLSYYTAAGIPKKVETVKRSLFKWPEGAVYEGVQQLELAGKGKFGVKENTTVFLYNKITHGGDLKMPVSLADRVVKAPENGWQPAPGFEGYMVTEN